MEKKQSVVVRIAEIGDAPVIVELSHQLGYKSSVGETEKRLSFILDSDDQEVFVVCIADKVVGWIDFFLAYRLESGPFVELGGLVVDESHRRMGIGRMLLNAVEKWSKVRGIRRIRVRSRTSREDAKAFYEKFGYKITKTQNVFDKQLR